MRYIQITPDIMTVRTEKFGLTNSSIVMLDDKVIDCMNFFRMYGRYTLLL